MFLKVKKVLFSFITGLRTNRLGSFLYTFCYGILDALENKNNDFESNGERWLIENLESQNRIVVFDVGGNVGVWSRMVWLHNNQAQIHSFEPVPEIYERLVKNVNQCESIFPNNIALGAAEGFLRFNYYPKNSLFSSFYDHPMGKSLGIELEVNVQTGDNYCQINEIEYIDFLKIDVEGFESNVLSGFEKMINSKRIKMIQFEYGDLVLKSRFLLVDFYNLLESKGYKVGKLFPGYVDFSPYNVRKENFLTSNFVAVLV